MLAALLDTGGEARWAMDNASKVLAARGFSPEIVDLAAFVNRMGARVVGAGSSTITITGVDELHSVEHEVIPDRVEAATYLTILGAARGDRAVGVRHRRAPFGRRGLDRGAQDAGA